MRGCAAGGAKVVRQRTRSATADRTTAGCDDAEQGVGEVAEEVGRGQVRPGPVESPAWACMSPTNGSLRTRRR